MSDIVRDIMKLRNPEAPEAADEIERLRAERDAAVSKLYNLEALRPHWAKGHSTDSVAAQVATSALSQVWTFLGVSDQTQCVQKLRAVLAERDRLRDAYTKMNTEVCQRLGKALGYPWFKDDQENFPGATEENGVCTGEHVAESIAAEAARRIDDLEAERDRLRVRHSDYMNDFVQMGMARDAAEAERDRLREARDAAARVLHEAGEQFAYYANAHAKKGTSDGDVKAVANQQWSQRCFNAHDAALKETGHE
jgi:hypothetical protein